MDARHMQPSYSYPPNIGAQPVYNLSSSTLPMYITENFEQIINRVITAVMHRLPANNPNTSSNSNLSNSQNNQNLEKNCNVINSSDTLSNFEAIKVLPVFDNEGPLHPVDFLLQLETNFNIHNIPYDKFKYRCNDLFKNSAKLWANAILHKFKNYSEFKVAFLEHFWGPHQQHAVSTKIESDTYTEGSSIVDFFTYHVGLAKHLQPPYSDDLLIATIARNLPPHVSTMLVGATDIKQALDRLRLAEYYTNKNKHSYQRTGNFNHDTNHFKFTGGNKAYNSFQSRDQNKFQKRNMNALEEEIENDSENA